LLKYKNVSLDQMVASFKQQKLTSSNNLFKSWSFKLLLAPNCCKYKHVRNWYGPPHSAAGAGYKGLPRPAIQTFTTPLITVRNSGKFVCSRMNEWRIYAAKVIVRENKWYQTAITYLEINYHHGFLVKNYFYIILKSIITLLRRYENRIFNLNKKLF
jgi:hypothetical protein